MGAPPSPDPRSVLAQTSVFAGLDRRQLEQLGALCVRKRYRAREVVLKKGDPALQLFVIVTGRLKALTTGADGRQAALNIMGPGEVFGEVAVLDGQPRSATITAIEPCELLVIHRNELFHFLERSPSAALKLLEVLARRLRTLSERFEDSAFLEVPERLAKQLVRLAERYGEKRAGGAVLIGLKLSQQELGDLCGASRETVNKQLRAWESDGIIAQENGRILVRNLAALRVR
jgi:CRP/FNR family transcriptional regulator, cyclic AMP receptor protein